MVSNLPAVASNLIAMALQACKHGLQMLQPTSDGLNLLVASNLLPMASNLLAMASKLVAMASTPTSDGLQPASDGLQPTSDGLQAA